MSRPEDVTGAPLLTLTIQLRADATDEEVTRQVLAAWQVAKPLPLPQVEPEPEPEAGEAENLEPGWGIGPSGEVGMPGIRVQLPE